MTKLFGEYLVEKGHLSKSGLLTALVQQIKTIPSITEVIFDQGLMEHESMLKVLLHQHHNKLGFAEAAKQLNLWTPEIHNQLDKHIVESKIPLGEILVNSGTVSLDVIAEALDVFLTETKFAPEEKQKQQEKQEQQVNQEQQPQAAPAPKDLTTYFEQFSLENYLELKILLSLSHHKPLTEALIAKAIDTLQLYKGTARFVSLPQSEVIIAAMLASFEELSGKDLSTVPADRLLLVEDFELKTLDVLWQIREELENQKTEEDIIKEFNLASSIELIRQGLKL
jgi:hypothetical protein